MNKRQKLVQQQFLNNEEEVIKRLKGVYSEALTDIEKKTKELQAQITDIQSALDSVEDEAERKRLKSMQQSKIYQKQYQDALKKQISGILDNMQVEEFKTISDYLKRCYEDGFIGTLYDLRGQGIPLCFPLDQEAMVRAVQLDLKISDSLYSSLGEDVAELKKSIAAEVSRGISTGMSFQQVAKQIRNQMMGAYEGRPGGALYRSMLIARTEGHRIQCQSAMDACYKAKDKGADVVKQWDATLDAKTRESHVRVDGEIRELDEKFSNGLMFPGDPTGGAAEVCNCRCALPQRARWAVGGAFTKMNNFTKELETFDSPEDYDEFKKAFFSKENRQYMRYVESLENKYGTKDFAKILDQMTDDEYAKYTRLTKNNPIFNRKGLENSENSGKIKLPDIQIGRSVGAKANTYDVLDLKTGEMFHFVEGSRLQNVEVFAGKGSHTVYQNAYKYADRHGGNVEDWQHVKGIGVLETIDGEFKAEVHWSQCENIGKFDFFVKRWLE